MLVKAVDLTKLNNGTKIIVFAVLALCVYVISLMLLALNPNSYVESQSDLFLFLNDVFGILPDAIWNNLTFLGDALIALPLLSFFCLINPRTWMTFFATIPSAVVLCHIGKYFFEIPRPAGVLDSSTFNIIGETLTAHNSFPSGHTLTIFSIIFAIVFTHNLFRNKWPTFLILSFAALVALSRVAVGAHWPYDLIFGAFLGAAAALHGSYLTRHTSNWWQWINTKRYCAALSVFIFPVVIVNQIITDEIQALAVVWVALVTSITVGFILISKARSSL